jgi:hypothetical protein
MILIVFSSWLIMVPFETLVQAILNTVAYADIFQYPLTEEQIHRYLIGVKSTPRAVRNALRTSPRLGKNLVHYWPFYMLCGREDNVQTRLRRANKAETLWPKAIYYGGLIARLPFVRMVAVTGALAMNNVDDGADIDYLIVTSSGRLWLCRGLVVALVKWASLRGITLCPNYLLSERALVFPDQSLYAAHELTQMVPLHGQALYQRMLYVNRWTEQFLPNATSQPHLSYLGLDDERDALVQRSWLKSGAENLLDTPAGAWLERWEMRRKIQKLTSKRPKTLEVDFSADYCKGHFERHGEKTLNSYALHLDRMGIDVGG